MSRLGLCCWVTGVRSAIEKSSKANENQYPNQSKRLLLLSPKGFKSLGDTWADTTTSHGHLMLTVLAGLAEFERDLIRARTGEGRERAKARGVKLGRKPKLTDHQKRGAIRRRDLDGEPVREIARSYNVSHSTISRLTG